MRNLICVVAIALAVGGCSTVSGLESAYTQGYVNHANTDMQQISQMLELRYFSHGELPASLDEFNPKDPETGEVIVSRIPTDPWGNEYSYQRISPREYAIRSCGPDKKAGTCDDIEQRRTVCN